MKHLRYKILREIVSLGELDLRHRWIDAGIPEVFQSDSDARIMLGQFDFAHNHGCLGYEFIRAGQRS